MGLTSLKALDEFIAANRRHYGRYRARLDAMPGLHLISYREGEQHNFQYVVVEVDATTCQSAEMTLSLLTMRLPVATAASSASRPATRSERAREA